MSRVVLVRLSFPLMNPLTFDLYVVGAFTQLICIALLATAGHLTHQ
jgi:hypothetical protein